MLFFGNEREKKRHQLLRILKEFPWLWAVKSSWSVNYDRIRVHRANWSFILDKPKEPRHVWVKVRMHELQSVIFTTQQPDQNLAEAVVGAISSGCYIEYVVIATTKDGDGRGKDFVILRNPDVSQEKTRSLHHFCCRAGFPRLALAEDKEKRS